MTVYEVRRNTGYRGHPSGAVFEATLDAGAEQRALARGDIQIRHRTIPTLQPGSYRLPRGWLNQERGGVATHG